MIRIARKIFADEYRRNVLLNYIFRCITIILGLFTVRVNLGYLGNTLYGLWVTIASVISWMSSGDFGISNGLRNELTKAYGKQDVEKQKKLVATAVRTLSLISASLFAVVLVLSEFFFYVELLDANVRYPMYITAFFFCANLVFSICQSVAYSFQKSWLTSAVNCMGQFLSITIVLVLSIANIPANLIIFAVVNGICTTLPNLVLIFKFQKNGIAFWGNDLKKHYCKKLRSSILNIGLQFFGLQLCSIILYSTDNFIINYLMGSSQVTKYSIITKIYDTGTSLFSILLIALWSAVTYHITLKDYIWVKNKIKELLRFWIVFALGVLIVSIFLNTIVTLWLGENGSYYEPSLVILFGVYCAMTAFSSIFVNVLNGMGTIKLQLAIAVVGALINIPLSVFFAQYCRMGIFGVKFATFICAAMTAIVLPIQAIKVLNKKISQQKCEMEKIEV